MDRFPILSNRLDHTGKIEAGSGLRHDFEAWYRISCAAPAKRA